MYQGCKLVTRWKAQEANAIIDEIRLVAAGDDQPRRVLNVVHLGELRILVYIMRTHTKLV